MTHSAPYPHVSKPRANGTIRPTAVLVRTQRRNRSFPNFLTHLVRHLRQSSAILNAVTSGIYPYDPPGPANVPVGLISATGAA